MILKRIDQFLNSITMYRLVLYGLIGLAAVAMVYAAAGQLPYSPAAMLGSLTLILFVCYISNHLLAWAFRAQANIESLYITAFILFFLLTPFTQPSDVLFTATASAVAMASKYVLAIYKKHLFNPAAFSIFILGTAGLGAGSWWVSDPKLLPFVAVIGLLFVRKIRRFHLFFSFMAVATVVVTLVNINNNMDPTLAFIRVFTAWPTIFFATVMLTEPLTTPPSSRLQLMYGALVGLFFGLPFSIGPFYSSAETALVIGNVFSYLMSPKRKLVLTLKEKTKLTADMWEFAFTPDKSFTFRPGQYMEWTLSHKHPDSRGNRRYFTIASAPTGRDVRLGVKLAPVQPSSFKIKLNSLKKGETIIAGQVAGDFTLPQDANRKVVFIAGGIGITPFKSMIQYLQDTNQKCDGVLFYSAPTDKEFAYKDFFDGAEKKTGIRAVYIITKQQNVPKNWNGKTGYITTDVVKSEVPDYLSRTFYLSGPISMVDSYKTLLKNLGISKNKIVTDYFPGF